MRHFRLTLLISLASCLIGCIPNGEALLDEQKVELGRQIFFDTQLSEPVGQSCGSCHNPSAAFSDPTMHVSGVSEGADGTKFGSRNTPSISYAFFSPPARFDTVSGTVVGGQFLDHRSATLAEQALKPFVSAVEMANADGDAVVAKVMMRPYAGNFRAKFGDSIFNDKAAAYALIGDAIAEFERSAAFGKFDSKFDLARQGKMTLSETESRGLALFNGKAKCAACHPSAGNSPLFTDFTNDNIGVPKNNDAANGLPIYATDAGFIDRGLGATLDDSTFDGRFKVPTLRNVAKTAPYMHNGFFKNLRDVVRFYNTACAGGNPDGWAAPEIEATRNCKELGDLQLSADELDAIVLFLETLSDGYRR